MAPLGTDTESLVRAIDSADGQGIDEADRVRLLTAARELCERIETPNEWLLRHVRLGPWTNIATKLALDGGLLQRLADEAGSETQISQTAAQLCQGIDMEVALAERLLRHLAATNVIDQTGKDAYRATKLSTALLKPALRAWLDLGVLNLRVLHGSPQYFSKVGYKNPVTAPGVWQHAFDTDLSYFEYLSANPAYFTSFQTAMKETVSSEQPGWCDIFPAETLLAGATDDEPAVIVDVGGGWGHDLEKMLKKHEDGKMRLVLQDLPKVIQSATQNPRIEKIEHDFKTEQPVKGIQSPFIRAVTEGWWKTDKCPGARTYYFHHIFHDWPDAVCLEILRHTKDAMKPGYSTLLIHDGLILESKPNPLTTSMDLHMMMLLAAKERTETDWSNLLGSVGLQMVKIHEVPGLNEVVIEAELA